MIFGVDVSNHQTHFDFEAAAREGFDFAFIKSSQDDNFKDRMLNDHLANARAAGLLVAAYHYQGTGPVERQVETIRAMVRPYDDVPVILDVEEGSGGVDITRALVDALRAEGYSVPLLYLPRWYWSGHIGSPDLSGLPPLWVSWYPDYTTRRKEQGVAMVPASVWSGYGGLGVEIVQFTSSGAVADYPNGDIDLNAFRGTREELAAQLGGTTGKKGGGAMPNGLFRNADNKDDDRVWCVSGDGVNFTKRHVALIEELELWKKLGVEGVPVPWAWLAVVPDIGDSHEDSLVRGLRSQIDGAVAALMAVVGGENDPAAIKQAVLEAMAEGAVQVNVAIADRRDQASTKENG